MSLERIVGTRCSQHGFTYIRGWIQMVLAPNDLFSWNNNTMSYILVMDMFHYCCPMHTDTNSVHNRSLKPWWSHLPYLQSFCCLLSSPVWIQLTLDIPLWGPGPPTPKMASPLLGSPHTPFPGSGTLVIFIYSHDKSSLDLDGLSLKFIKYIAYEISGPLAFIFHQSPTQGVNPERLKMSRIVPIFKASNKRLCDNYRPNSLVSSLSKY
jgi:hypothetical protein